MRKNNIFQYVVSIGFVLGAFLFSYWPLSIVGVLVAVMSGRYVLAMALCVLLDIAYGTPIGILHIVQYPFTVLGLLVVAVHSVVSKYIWKGHANTL